MAKTTEKKSKKAHRGKSGQTASKPKSIARRKNALPKKRAKTPRQKTKGAAHDLQKQSLLGDEERDVWLALQDRLGIPSGSRPSDNDECDRVGAYHEAGHAVIGCALGRTLRCVGLDSHCEFDLPGKWTRTQLAISATIALAGPYAEAKASREGVSVGAGSDIPRAIEDAKKLAHDRWEEELDELSIEAQRLVIKHWSAIKRVAQRILSRGSLVRHKELRKLLKDSQFAPL